MTHGQIAERFGVARPAVSLWFRKGGMKLDWRDRYTEEERRERVLELRALGYTHKRIGKEMGISDITVGKVLRAAAAEQAEQAAPDVAAE
jgi:DNA invertase Pin-like site-specific DNA recombinase